MSCVLCDKMMPLELKGSCIRILYGIGMLGSGQGNGIVGECSGYEVMLRWMCAVTRINIIGNS